MTDKARDLLDYEHHGLTCGEELNWVQYDKAIAAINAALRTAPAIDLRQFRDLIGFACLHAINLHETDPRRDYIRQCSDLLAMIDGQKGVG